jgi:hypothetical protein
MLTPFQVLTKYIQMHLRFFNVYYFFFKYNFRLNVINMKPLSHNIYIFWILYYTLAAVGPSQ